MTGVRTPGSRGLAALLASRREEREQMVARQVAARGITQPAVLEAMREVPREVLVPDELAEFAYEDTPLPIPAEQTISQPYIVALMIEALDVQPGERVLEIGSGSGYAAAVLSRIAKEVYAVERHAELVSYSRERLRRMGYDNVQVRHDDGTLGWPEHAPYDAILVSAGGPRIPPSLRDQLAIGGRLVMPVAQEGWVQRLVRVIRRGETDYGEELFEEVSFVPLVGDEGWDGQPPTQARGLEWRTVAAPPVTDRLRHLVREAAEPFSDLSGADLQPLLRRIGDARLVLIGEASHGTSEFYRMRARITRELIAHLGFRFVAVEADWPDAARIDHYVRNVERPRRPGDVFTRFPTWMWRNEEVLEFVEWLREHNAREARPVRRDRIRRDARSGRDGLVSFHGLDLYSLSASLTEVIRYLEQVDPDTARVARQRYGCLTPFESDPASYGLAAVSGRYRTCEPDVVAMLVELQRQEAEYTAQDRERFFEAEQNARVAANAERYYRVMYYGGADSWNLRDSHMFETLQALLDFHGPDARGVVWAHNSHLGNAAATEMSARGEHNLGQLVRRRYGFESYLIGFGTDRGTVAAATEWGGPMEIKQVRPARRDSYEGLFHETGPRDFLVHLRRPVLRDLRDELARARLERAIGVIYRPDTELQSHYFQARLPNQFDEYIWFDETRAVRALGDGGRAPELPHAHPFATIAE